MRARLFLVAVPTAAYALLPARASGDPLCVAVTVAAGGQLREVAPDCVPFAGRTSCLTERAGFASSVVQVVLCGPQV